MLFLLSKKGRIQIETEARGSSSSMVKLGQGHVKDFTIPMPPLDEMKRIAEECDASSKRIDELITVIESAVDRLTEYRTALITAATTGKIDVRKVKIPKPSA